MAVTFAEPVINAQAGRIKSATIKCTFGSSLLSPELVEDQLKAAFGWTELLGFFIISHHSTWDVVHFRNTGKIYAVVRDTGLGEAAGTDTSSLTATVQCFGY